MGLYLSLLILIIYELMFVEAHDDQVCPGIVPPYPARYASPSLAQSSQGGGRQFEYGFIQYKILYLLDETVSNESKSKFENIFRKVNEKLSKVVRARKLKDVRIVERQWEDGTCGLCDWDKVIFPDEFVIPCPNKGIKRGPTERVKYLNTQNYTLAIRVLLLWEGEGKNLRNHSCLGRTIAYARMCSPTDWGYGVDHGTIVYCNVDGLSEEKLEANSLHETLHVMLPSLVVHYPEETCPGAAECVNRTWLNVSRPMFDANGQTVQKYSYISIVPELRAAAQEYFDCDRALGLELQSVWNATTGRYEPNFFHWSEHLFPEEILSPVNYASRRLSNLTLSVLAAHRDWYRIDTSKAEPMFHKIRNGCDRLEIGCQGMIAERRGQAQPSSVQPFCDASSGPDRVITSHCTHDHRITLQCHRVANTSTNNDCATLIARAQGHDHYVCAETTALTSDLTRQIGAYFGVDTICVTILYSHEGEHTSMPVCVRYECNADDRVLSLKFQPRPEVGAECFVNCSSADSNRIVEGRSDIACRTDGQMADPIRLICPDYQTICPDPVASTVGSSTASASALISSSIRTTPASNASAVSTVITSSTSSSTGFFIELEVFTAASLLMIVRTELLASFCH